MAPEWLREHVHMHSLRVTCAPGAGLSSCNKGTCAHFTDEETDLQGGWVPGVRWDR